MSSIVRAARACAAAGAPLRPRSLAALAGVRFMSSASHPAAAASAAAASDPASAAASSAQRSAEANAATAAAASAAAAALADDMEVAGARPDDADSHAVKDARHIFELAWADLVAQRGGLHNLCFPREVVWLTGAPGAGKGTMTSVILAERDLRPEAVFEVSSLLSTPAFASMKAAGVLIGDKEVVQAVLLELMSPRYALGAIVDGFPRTEVQAHAIRMLRDRMAELWTEHRNHATLKRVFRRPNFSIACFYCTEQESVKRQLQRGAELARLNKMVEETGVGSTHSVRTTDVSEAAALKRYRIFKDEVYASLTAIKEHFAFHFIDASGPVEAVKAQLLKEFAFQSSLDLDEHTFELVRRVESASMVTRQARTFLVTRLNSYALDHAALFTQVVDLLENEFLHIIRRQSLAGAAVIRSNNALLETPIAVNILLDVLSERGFTCVLDVVRTPVPLRLEPLVYGDTVGPRIITRIDRTFVFHITFPKPEIRRSASGH
jgi:adenylate kinase